MKKQRNMTDKNRGTGMDTEQELQIVFRYSRRFASQKEIIEVYRFILYLIYFLLVREILGI